MCHLWRKRLPSAPHPSANNWCTVHHSDPLHSYPKTYTKELKNNASCWFNTRKTIQSCLAPIRKNSAKSTFKIIQKSTRSKVFLEYRIKHAHISNNCTSYLCPTNKTLSATNVRFCCVLSLSSLNEQVSVVSLNEKFRVLTIFRKIWSEVVNYLAR